MASLLLLLGATSELVPLLVLALIQGISEFLPISSDGHLTLAQHFMDVDGPRLGIEVALHLGTLGSVLVVFRRDVGVLVRQMLGGDWREAGLILLGSVPAAIVGLGLKKTIEPMFDSGRAAALGLLATAAALWVGERARRRAVPGAGRPIRWTDALWIGSAQALAILPGVSRSGTTITTALVLGAETNAAARFSFLLSIPAVAGAVLLEVPDLVRTGEFGRELALAVVATFLIGVGALNFLLAFLGRGAFRWCAIYCSVVGVVALFLTS